MNSTSPIALGQPSQTVVSQCCLFLLAQPSYSSYIGISILDYSSMLTLLSRKATLELESLILMTCFFS